MLTEVALKLIACSKHSVLISNLLTLLRVFFLGDSWETIAYQKPEPCGFRVVSSIILTTFTNSRNRRFNCCVTLFHVRALQWPVHTILVRQTTSTSENNDGFPFENNGIVCLRRRVDAGFNGTRAESPGLTLKHTHNTRNWRNKWLCFESTDGHAAILMRLICQTPLSSGNIGWIFHRSRRHVFPQAFFPSGRSIRWRRTLFTLPYLIDRLIKL